MSTKARDPMILERFQDVTDPKIRNVFADLLDHLVIERVRAMRVPLALKGSIHVIAAGQNEPERILRAVQIQRRANPNLVTGNASYREHSGFDFSQLVVANRSFSFRTGLHLESL